MSENIPPVDELKQVFYGPDIEFIHPFHDAKACKQVEVDGSEVRLLFRFTKDTEIRSPISGNLDRVYLYPDSVSYAYVIQNEYTTLLMSAITDLVLPLNTQIKAGQIIGKIVIPDGMLIWELYMQIASKREWINLYWVTVR